ncbi:MAG: methyltransferase domain-containing protein [Desulfatibacillum sp.]|nr:methyltransferase domain-containing protein [Desulfatibacillum sp.]
MKKSLPKIGPDAGELSLLPYEVIKWELLKTALELDVFRHLEEPVSANDLAAKLSAHPQNTELMLNALATLGCLNKSNGLFEMTPLARAYFNPSSELYIGPILLFSENWNKPMLNGGMKDLICNGPKPVENIGGEEIWEQGARASINHARCGRAQEIAACVAALPEFGAFKRMLDMGGGPGMVAVAVAAAHPSMTGVIIEQPAVCRVARELIAEYGMESRISTVSGDYMEDPLDENYDFVMANYTLNFYRHRLDELMSKVYKAINPGGVFLVTSDGLSKEKTAPSLSVITWLSTALQGMDMSFERGFVADAMIRAGFESTQSTMVWDLPLASHGPMDVIVARKA